MKLQLALTLCALLLGSAFGTQTEEGTQNAGNTSPCPCKDQPEGIMMPHPTDCRAYYTCLGSSNVKYSRCERSTQLFHPYLRACVERSKYHFGVPNIVGTKDLCKVNAVFRAPAAENFDNCHITSEDDPSMNSDSVEDGFSNDLDDLFTSAPITENVGFPWESTTPLDNSRSQSRGFPDNLTSVTNDVLHTTTTTTSTTTPSPAPVECKIAKVTVHHYPGPCTAEITCESGVSFNVNNCLNTLTFISQVPRVST